MKRRWFRTTSLLAAMIGSLSGCANEAIEARPPDEPWSTKNQSVLARDTALSQIDVVEAVTGQTATELRASAIGILLKAADSTNPLLRANAIEALEPAPEALEPVVRLALGDENRGVRFVAATTVGRMKLEALAPLCQPLVDDPSPSVQAAAIYALRRNGRQVDLTPLAGMVLSDDPEIKANAAFILGELGDSSALPLLRDAVNRRLTRIAAVRARIVDLQLAEAMVKLGSERELEAIRAALFAAPGEGEITVLACQICGRLKDEPYAAALHDMAVRTGREEEPPEIRLAAAEAMAHIDPRRAPIEVPLAYVGSDRYELRAQAAAALGWFGARERLPILGALMMDPNPLVQVAAAGAVVRLTAP